MSAFFRPGNSLRRTFLFYHWQLFLMDLRRAGVNLGTILRSEKPRMGQFANGLWATLWGINMIVKGPAIFAASPRIYAWMHWRMFAHLPAQAWGVAALGLGLLQIYALCWPMRHPVCKCKSAARLMCSWWSGMLMGFVLSGVPGNADVFYAFFTAGSIWVLWRLGDRNEPNC